MEKTLKYNLDESYAQGYNDAREDIAKEIEANINNALPLLTINALKHAINIAKGQK